MDIFREGNLCSLRNVKAAPVIQQTESQIKVGVSKHTTAYDFLINNLHEPALSTLYDYVSQCG